MKKTQPLRLPLLLALVGGALVAQAAWATNPEPAACPTNAAWRSQAPRPDRRPLAEQQSTPPTLANPTRATQALYDRLKQNETLRSALFGQQHASWQGVAGKRPAFGSDVFDGLQKQVKNRPNLVPDHPAVFGWNYETYRSLIVEDQDQAQADSMLARIIQTAANGGITTIHWPVENFVVCGGKTCDDHSGADGVDPVEYIVNNYKAFDQQCSGDKFDRWVDDLATFLQQLTLDGKPIPVILRPFHEMNGNDGPDAHWWAGRNPAQFRTMWQRLVDGLRNRHGLRNVLIAFGPRAEPALANGYGAYWPEDSYPGQASQRYVDIAGFDFYLDYTGKDDGVDAAETKKLGDAIDATRAFAKDAARSVKRVMAITEVGRKDATSDPSKDTGFVGFWMKGVKPALDAQMAPLRGELAKSRWEGIAYVMTWTNRADGNFSIDPTAKRNDGQPDPELELKVNSDFADWFQLDETLFLRGN